MFRILQSFYTKGKTGTDGEQTLEGRGAGDPNAPGQTLLKEVHLDFVSVSQVQAISSSAPPRQCTHISQHRLYTVLAEGIGKGLLKSRIFSECSLICLSLAYHRCAGKVLA